jgi:Ion channel
MVDNKIYAPKIDITQLWQMSADEFNDWREKNDYPRIINFLKRKLPDFEVWMMEQELFDDILIKYSPSTFLKDQSQLFLYKVLYDSKEEREILSEARHDINDIFFHKNLVKQRKNITPYPVWYLEKHQKRSPEISVNLKQGRSCFLFSELELLDLGNYNLVNQFPIGDRHLDFTNIGDLRIINCINNSNLKLWFCSATNLTIEGDLAFVDAYETRFYEVHNQKFTNLKLINGSFQSWTFLNCEVNLAATNAVIHLWSFTGWDFTATINNSDIRECYFVNSHIRYPIDFGRIRDFHAHVKRLYSQIGKRNEASHHYYLEKTYERKSFLHLKENRRNEYFRSKGKFRKLVLKTKYNYKYLYSGFINILWGYGERPTRVFGISLVTILFFALVYCYSPEASSQTRQNITNSLYYSMVTFTTLGYGDISQTNGLLKLLSGVEALLGMTFWGILVAGFTSKAKDY